MLFIQINTLSLHYQIKRGGNSINTAKNKMNTVTEKILAKLELIKQGFATQYFTIEDRECNTVKIRVGDHSANRHNNGDTKTLSFITERCDQGYKAMINEWVIDEDGYTTDTFQSIEELLDWNEIDN